MGPILAVNGAHRYGQRIDQCGVLLGSVFYADILMDVCA